MRFWKIFAWISLAWAVVARRGAGVIVRKKGDAEPESAQSGPGWKRVSTKTYGIPQDPPSEDASEPPQTST